MKKDEYSAPFLTTGRLYQTKGKRGHELIEKKKGFEKKTRPRKESNTI